MDAMPPAPAHAKPARRDHLWVLAIIAAFALFDVWGAWAQVGDKSGFAVGNTGTGWTLTVIVEAAAGYFLFAWFNAPGRRSRRFAMCSAFAALTLSLIGQGASSFAAKAQPPAWLAVFVKDLPVVVLALIAVLIHMRRLDREDADSAARKAGEAARLAAEEAAAADERTALRVELATLAAEVEPLREALAAAQRDAAQANEKAESIAAKLAARKPNRTRTKAPNAGRRKDPNAAPNGRSHTAPNAAPETEVPDDFDARAEALEIWLANPGISGKDLGARVGLGERWGQLRKTEFRNASAGSERSDERS